MSVSLGPLICRRRPSLSMIDGAGEFHPSHPGLGRIEHRIEKFERDLAVRVGGEQLIELDRFAHHGIVEERYMHRLFQPLEHLLGLVGQRVQPGRRHVDAHGKDGTDR